MLEALLLKGKSADDTWAMFLQHAHQHSAGATKVAPPQQLTVSTGEPEEDQVT